MRTISAIALCLMLVFATTGCAASKIAVVDPARLFQESEPGKAGIEHLKQLEAAMQEQLKTAQGMIEKAPNDEALRARFQKTFVGYQQIVNAEQQKVVQQINGLMQKTLEDFMGGFSFLSFSFLGLSCFFSSAGGAGLGAKGRVGFGCSETGGDCSGARA